jgi:rRNA maturation RNase YbeY
VKSAPTKSRARHGGAAINIEIQSIASARGHVPFLRDHLKAAHRILQPKLTELSLALVGSADMRRLHTEFLSQTDSTDVLTFELEHDSHGRVLGGEVVVCVPVARRQAKILGNRVGNELLLYALHGMLHLCGFDDRTPADFAAMHVREDQILTQLGVGQIFRPLKIKPAARRRSGVR